MESTGTEAAGPGALKLPEFTSEEKKTLEDMGWGKTEELYPKFRQTLAVQLAQMLAKLMGVETLDQLPAKVANLVEPMFQRGLMELGNRITGLPDNPAFIEAVAAKVGKVQAEGRDDKTAWRQEEIERMVAEVRGVPVGKVNQDLVADIDKGFVLKGGRADGPMLPVPQRFPAVQANLEARHGKMVTAIKALIAPRKKVKDDYLAVMAWQLVDEVVDSGDLDDVREALVEADQEKKILPSLRKQ